MAVPCCGFLRGEFDHLYLRGTMVQDCCGGYLENVRWLGLRCFRPYGVAGPVGQWPAEHGAAAPCTVHYRVGSADGLRLSERGLRRLVARPTFSVRLVGDR